MTLPTRNDIANARLPQTYLTALKALRKCATTFTPERYATAVVAVGDAWSDDEISTWPVMDQLATYARISDDDRMMRLTARVERKRSEWKAGEVAA